MSAETEQGEVGGSTEADGPADPGPPEHREGPDAAEAAGFGGIAWADESAEGRQPVDDEQHLAGTVADAGSSAAPPSTEPADDGSGEAQPHDTEVSVEDLVQDLERVASERDQYLDDSRRIQAEFENYRKAVAKRGLEARERANESLVTEILPVLDACDGALANGSSDVEPVWAALMGALTKQGLERIDDQDSPFDPARHDAVMHEPAEGAEEARGPIVAEIMRAGYSWKGRVVRPAMVRVRG